MTLCPGLPGMRWYQKKHSPTHHPDHHPVFISFFYLLRSIASSLFKLRVGNLFAQPLSTSSWSTSWSGALLIFHTFLQSSPNQCLLFTTHAHTITTSFAVVSRLYHLFLVFVSIPSLELYLLPWHYTSIWPFSSLLAEVPPFLSWQARSHFCIAYYFAHNCYSAQPPSPNQWYITITQQWYQLAQFIPSKILAFTATPASPSTLNISPR